MAKHKKVTVAKKRDFSKAIPWVAGIGLLATIELIVVYFMANFVPDATPSICSINSKEYWVFETDFAILLRNILSVKHLAIGATCFNHHKSNFE